MHGPVAELSPEPHGALGLLQEAPMELHLVTIIRVITIVAIVVLILVHNYSYIYIVNFFTKYYGDVVYVIQMI